MKRLLVFICFIQLTCIAAFSQTYSDSTKMLRDYLAHNSEKFLTVKGIELRPGLKMEDALNLLLKKGVQKSDLFEMAKSNLGIYDLKGTFFSRTNCSIKVQPTSTDKTIVGVIGISFPEASSFKQLKSEYDNLKSALSEKYYLSRCQEKFDDSYVEKTTSDYLKLSAIEKDEAIFETCFCVSNNAMSMLLGQVKLRINHLRVNYETTYFVSLIYTTSDDIFEQLASAKDDL